MPRRERTAQCALYTSWEAIHVQVDKAFLSKTTQAQQQLLRRVMKRDQALASPPQEYQRAYQAAVHADIARRPWAYDYGHYMALQYLHEDI